MADEQNPLSVSDEDFAEMSFEDIAADTPDTEEPTAEAEETDEGTEPEGEAVTGDESEEEDVAEEEDPATDETSDDAEDDEDDSEDTEESSSDDEAPELDYETEYKKLLAPFKANGRDIQVESVEDAVQLMQMGANYNKKMAGLKPNLKMLKMLEKNDLLTEDKLHYLIDLDKKNPDAIKKLVQDSKISPEDFEENEGEQSEYKPNTYTVDDSELALDDVLNDISSTKTYSETIDIISTKWDDKSRESIVGNPQIIKVINDHVENGMYAKITEVVEREKMLGRLNGVTDLDAYRQIGDRLHSEGKFNTPAQSEPVSTPVTPVKTKAPNPQAVSRKRAAAPTKSTPSAKAAPSEFNPLALSDEEFEKNYAAKYL